jgi:hypothetical protein
MSDNSRKQAYHGKFSLIRTQCVQIILKIINALIHSGRIVKKNLMMQATQGSLKQRIPASAGSWA